MLDGKCTHSCFYHFTSLHAFNELDSMNGEGMQLNSLIQIQLSWTQWTNFFLWDDDDCYYHLRIKSFRRRPYISISELLTKWLAKEEKESRTVCLWLKSSCIAIGWLERNLINTGRLSRRRNAKDNQGRMLSFSIPYPYCPFFLSGYWTWGQVCRSTNCKSHLVSQP